MLLSFGLGASLAWYFRAQVFLWLVAPAAGQLSTTGSPIFTSPTEMFSLTIRMSMTVGCVAALPVLVVQVVGFLSPMLSKAIRRFLVLFLPAALAFYLMGIAFAYFVLLPAGLRFLLHFGTDIATPMIRMTEYMDLTLAMLFWLGVVFELPLAMFLLAKLGVVSSRRFRRFRRYVPAAAFILGALITPTFDAVNQTLVAVPIILLYEAGVSLAWIAERRFPRWRLGLGAHVRRNLAFGTTLTVAWGALVTALVLAF